MVLTNVHRHTTRILCNTTVCSFEQIYTSSLRSNLISERGFDHKFYLNKFLPALPPVRDFLDTEIVVNLPLSAIFHDVRRTYRSEVDIITVIFTSAVCSLATNSVACCAQYLKRLVSTVSSKNRQKTAVFQSSRVFCLFEVKFNVAS